MRYNGTSDRLGGSFLMAVLLLVTAVSWAAPRPNVLVIMADDLGYSDLGCYGGEIKTPNLDALAANGLRFTQFYNTARCWPTRAALLTGYYAQQVRRDNVPGIRSGGQGRRPPWAVLLSVRLKALGYRTYHSGKWHLDGMPLKNGFDRSYYLRDQGRFFSPRVHYLDDWKQAPVERGTDYYGTTAIGKHAAECLEDHASNHEDKPFFQYLTFTAPHFPLHALPEDIDRYRETYQEGWDVVRNQRWQRMKELGLIDPGQELSPVEQDLGPPYHFPDHLKILGPQEVNRPLPWRKLTMDQQAFQSVKMAIHAAMIDRMDREIGRVLKQIKAMGAWENTLILFLSDNGASAEIMVRSDGHDPKAAPGSAASYLCLGPGWSTTSNTPFRRHKTWVHEGGIATPLIVSWPAHIQEGGGIRRNPAHVIDIVPTILQVSGGKPSTTFQGSIGPEMAGQSLVTVFSDDNTVTRPYFWWYHDGHRAIRKGHWKLVAPKGEPWELYDIRRDRAERNNLSLQRPGLVKLLEEEWHIHLETFKANAIGSIKKEKDQ